MSFATEYKTIQLGEKKMSFTRTKIAALGLLAGLQINASASLLQPREYEAAGLTWLTLAETVGLSVAYFENGAGGWNTKYRLASNDEIQALLSSFDIAPSEPTTKPIGNSRGFIFDIGGYNPDVAFGGGTWFRGGSQGSTGQTATAYVDVGRLDGDMHGDLNANCRQYYDCNYANISFGPQAPSFTSSTIGLFLVKRDIPTPSPIPEPSTLALFGAAAMIAYSRRRKIS
jgi:hypothetical protein